jgi:glycosyltransferase involved in cell wall biosynthesis
MSADHLSVALVGAAAPYQKTLATALLSAGVLRQLVSFAPVLSIQEPDETGRLRVSKSFSGFSFARRIPWGLWRRVPGTLRPRPPVVGTVWAADRLVSRWIASAKIFHGCTAVSLASLQAAKRKGATTFIEMAACHPRHWKKMDDQECRNFGARTYNSNGNLPERLIRRMESEFAICDHIVVPSAVAQKNFAEYGYGAKTLLLRTGVDAEFFFPSPVAVPQTTFRVCYVGRLEFGKGVGYLLQAWKRLALANAELLLIGERHPQMASMIRNCTDSSVRFTGFLPPAEVARCYRQSHLFVQPSPNEGLANVLLEAMASGLGVVATDRTGASECITNGIEGFIIPAGNLEVLMEAILWCYRHRAETEAMGKAARVRIESQFTLEHYNQRVLTLYRKAAGHSGAPAGE